MAITEWQHPIHECQKGEVTREWCYLEPYYFFKGGLKQYAELLQYAYNKQYAQNTPKTRPDYDKFLEEHPIKFHQYDIDKGCSPSHDQLRHWSKGQNIDCDVKYSWDDRRTSKRNQLNKLAEENMAVQLAEDSPYFYNSLKEDFLMVDESVENARSNGNLSPHQAESATRGKLHLIDGLIKLTGKDKDSTVKVDLDADVNSKTTLTNPALNKIAEAYLNGRKQYHDKSTS